MSARDHHHQHAWTTGTGMSSATSTAAGPNGYQVNRTAASVSGYDQSGEHRAAVAPVGQYSYPQTVPGHVNGYTGRQQAVAPHGRYIYPQTVAAPLYGHHGQQQAAGPSQGQNLWSQNPPVMNGHHGRHEAASSYQGQYGYHPPTAPVANAYHDQRQAVTPSSIGVQRWMQQSSNEDPWSSYNRRSDQARHRSNGWEGYSH